MRILVLIPARGGSKRLPGKNIRKLGGKPLICWSIDVAKDIPEICDVLVSTDEPEIAQLCKVAGAYVPWLRPPELATDTASSVDVALHALDWYEAERGAVDGLLLLQPTSPFRSKNSLLRGIELFRVKAFATILAVSPCQAHPMWTLKIEGDYLVPFMREHGFGMRSQELQSVYFVNGSMYLISPATLRASRSFLGEKTVPLIIESLEEAIDIDTDIDFSTAVQIAESKNVI